MTFDLASLRAMRKNSAATLAKITQELNKNSYEKKEDTRLWKATIDKVGNGSAVIRFLPAMVEGELPWVKVYHHAFQGPTGKWYIENCLTTIGQTDPVHEHCNALWNSKDEETARKRKRKLTYYANVLVVNDPAAPENNGTVRIFKFGKKIFDKLADKLQPQFEDEQALPFFDPYDGANFRLRIRKVEGWSNTDKSDFDSASELAGGDEDKMVEILKARHDLSEFVNPKNFKSYEELAKKLATVLSGDTASMKKASEMVLDNKETAPWDEAKAKVPAKTAPEPKIKAAPAEEEDDLSFFKSLVDD